MRMTFSGIATRSSSPSMRRSVLVTRRHSPRMPATPQLVRKPPPNRVLKPVSSLSSTFA